MSTLEEIWKRTSICLLLLFWILKGKKPRCVLLLQLVLPSVRLLWMVFVSSTPTIINNQMLLLLYTFFFLFLFLFFSHWTVKYYIMLFPIYILGLANMIQLLYYVVRIPFPSIKSGFMTRWASSSGISTSEPAILSESRIITTSTWRILWMKRPFQMTSLSPFVTWEFAPRQQWDRTNDVANFPGSTTNFPFYTTYTNNISKSGTVAKSEK